ncbi:BclA C-terminal domain-containing protein [Priestia megaterium]|uniref:BclA C-terminal domain-containing protein n=1 Tax=Priestia megaterium TaxID=1404 RepID=UPI00300A5A15
MPGSIESPAVATLIYNNDVIVSLAADNTITLQLFGIDDNVILVGEGATGVALTIIRLD